MTDSKQPARHGTVVSLVDRLPPERRARLLAKTALRGHVTEHNQMTALCDLAARINNPVMDEELAHFERARPTTLADWEQYADVRALMGLRLYLENKHEAAFATWASIIREKPDLAFQAFQLRAIFYGIRGDDLSALADIDQALKLQPNNPHLHASRGDVLLRIKRGWDAQASFMRALQLDPKNDRAFIGMGTIVQLTGDYDRAQGWFDRGLRRHPHHTTLLMARSFCYERQHRLPEAIADLNKAIELDPEDPEPYFARGRCWAYTDPSKAIADYTQVLELQPSNLQALTARANTYLAEGMLDEAMKDADQAVHTWPDDPLSYFTQALVHEMRDNLEVALDLLHHTVRLEPNEPIFLVKRMNLHGRMGHQQEMRADLDAAVVMLPEEVLLRIARAGHLINEGDFDKALQDLDLAVKQEPKNGRALFLRSSCKQALGNEAGALRDLKQAAKLGDRSALEALGNKAGAPRDLKRTTQRNEPNNKKKERA